MWDLVKINVLTFFDLHKLINAKTAKEKIGAWLRVFLLIFLVGLFTFTIYTIIKPNVKDYVDGEILFIVLAQYMAIASSFLVGSNIQKIDDLLFKFKDYDLLSAMPIGKSKVLLSKLIALYFSNLIYTFIFLLAPYLIYVQNVSVDFYFHFMFFTTLLVIPIVPIIISTILGIFFSFLQTLYKNSKALNILFTFLMFVFILGLTFYLVKVNTDVEEAIQIVEVFNRLYPLTSVYIKLLVFKDFASGLIFFFTPVILFVIYSYLINKVHDFIYYRLNYYTIKEDYKLTKLKAHSQTWALYRKEMKKYFSSNLYTMNTQIGSVLLTILTVMFVFLDHKFLDFEIGHNNLLTIIGAFTPMFIAGFILLNASTSASFSLEGLYIGVLKSLPIKPLKVILVKILVNLSISLPAILLNTSLLVWFLKPDDVFYFYYMPILYSFFISIVGISLNLKYPTFDYKSEVAVIKQSIPALVTLVVGVFLGVMPFSQELIVVPWLHIRMQTKFVEILTLILSLNLAFKVKKLYRKL